MYTDGNDEMEGNDMRSPWCCKKCLGDPMFGQRNQPCAKCFKHAQQLYEDPGFSGRVCEDCVSRITRMAKFGADKMRCDDGMNRYVELSDEIKKRRWIYCFWCMGLKRINEYIIDKDGERGMGCKDCIVKMEILNMKYCIDCNGFKQPHELIDGYQMCPAHYQLRILNLDNNNDKKE